MVNNIERYFINKGIVNPQRSIELIKKIINFLKLDLTNKVIFTEAASGEYIYTPIIAAMAGAKKVFAITSDSSYALKEEVQKDTYLFAELCGVRNKIEVVFNRDNISEADIITNLGFVRPINKRIIDRMKKEAVVPYMCEAWEVREGDVDIKYCNKKGITVMGTNENFKGVDVFNYSFTLALKMLFDANIEIYKCKIGIVGKGNFRKVIYNGLKNMGVNVFSIDNLNFENEHILSNTDAIIIADYTSSRSFIGKINSDISAKKLKEICSYVTVIQFAGIVDIEDLKENNIRFYPEYKVGSFKMGKTLAYLGPKPIIDLHCAGLKVGEIMYNIKQESYVKDQFLALCQKI